MSSPRKRKGVAFWSKAERAGEAMELWLRFVLGVVIAVALATIAWTLGSQIWSGVGVIAAVPAFLIGFPIGFFWLEVKLCLWLLLRLVFGFFS